MSFFRLCIYMIYQNWNVIYLIIRFPPCSVLSYSSHMCCSIGCSLIKQAVFYFPFCLLVCSFHFYKYLHIFLVYKPLLMLSNNILIPSTDFSLAYGWQLLFYYVLFLIDSASRDVALLNILNLLATIRCCVTLLWSLV